VWHGWRQRATCGIGKGDVATLGAGGGNETTHDAEEVARTKGRGREGTSTGLTSTRQSRSRDGEELARENILIENDMSRDDVVGEKVEAPVSLVVRGVPEEKATSGLGESLWGAMS
jgi:hypothetical protein